MRLLEHLPFTDVLKPQLEAMLVELRKFVNNLLCYVRTEIGHEF